MTNWFGLKASISQNSLLSKMQPFKNEVVYMFFLKMFDSNKMKA